MVTHEELERYAEIRAAIDLGGDAHEAMRAHGEAPETWAAFEARILEQVADQIDRGDVTGVAAFQRVFDARRGDRSDTDRPPTALQPHVDSADPTEPVDVQAIREQIVVGAAPFDAAARPAIPVSAQPVKVDFMQQSAQTLMNDGGEFRAMLEKSVLPFVPKPEGAPVKPAPRVTVELATGTEDIDEALMRGDLLPFAQPPAALPTERLPEAAALLQIARSAAPVSKMTTAPRPDAGLGPAVPFEKPTPALMPLDKYAEIHALLQREGDPMRTFARMGTTPDAWMSTVRAFARAFAKDPAMEAQFNALVRKNQSNAR